MTEGMLPEVLRQLYVGRRTGFLHFTRGDERRSVYFRVGHIVHGDTNVKEERLGETLVAQSVITAADLKRARIGLVHVLDVEHQAHRRSAN